MLYEVRLIESSSTLTSTMAPSQPSMGLESDVVRIRQSSGPILMNLIIIDNEEDLPSQRCFSIGSLALHPARHVHLRIQLLYGSRSTELLHEYINDDHD
jgi:hypothetical protein